MEFLANRVSLPNRWRADFDKNRFQLFLRNTGRSFAVALIDANRRSPILAEGPISGELVHSSDNRSPIWRRSSRWSPPNYAVKGRSARASSGNQKYNVHLFHLPDRDYRSILSAVGDHERIERLMIVFESLASVPDGHQIHESFADNESDRRVNPLRQSGSTALLVAILTILLSYV